MQAERVTGPISEELLQKWAEIASNSQEFKPYGLTLEKALPLLRNAQQNPKNTFWTAFTDPGHPTQSCLGFAWIVEQGAFARSSYLRLIAIDGKSTGQGAGRALLTAIEQEQLKPNGLFLLTTHTNQRARNFYESLGYQKTGEIPDYVVKGCTEIIYFKPGV